MEQNIEKNRKKKGRDEKIQKERRKIRVARTFVKIIVFPLISLIKLQKI